MRYPILALIAAAIAVAGPLSAQDRIAPGQVAFGEAGEVAASLTGAAGDPDRGAEILADKGVGNCIACHQIGAMPDVPWQGEIGPMLDGAADRWSEDQLRGIVANAKMTFPGTIMPAFYKTDGFTRPGDAFTGEAAKGPLDPLLTAGQVEDVVAYLMTLREQ